MDYVCKYIHNLDQKNYIHVYICTVFKIHLTIALALFNVSGTVDSLLFMVYQYSCNLWVIWN